MWRKEVEPKWDRIFEGTKVPTEIRHKTAPIDPEHFKGQLWQTLDMYCLATLAENLQFTSTKPIKQEVQKKIKSLKRALLLYHFIIRLFYHEDPVLTAVKLVLDVDEVVNDFLRAYAEVFTEFCFTFNLHLITHLHKSREYSGPLFKTSTHKYEGMYGKLKRCYAGK